MSAKVYMIGNAKGGVGKTTVSTMLAFHTSHFQKEKTLVIDMDSTPAATVMLTRSAGLEKITKTLMRGIRLKNLENEIISVNEFLDVIPGSPQLDELDDYLEEAYPGDRRQQINLINELLEPLKNKYDRIFFDLPPQYRYYHEAAILASDYCIIPLHAQELSLTAVEIYIKKMNNTAELYDTGIDVIGLVPVIVNKDSNEEMFGLEQVKDIFGDLVIETVMPHRERMKTFARTGILLYEDHKDTWIADAHNIAGEIWSDLQVRQAYFDN